MIFIYPGFDEVPLEKVNLTEATLFGMNPVGKKVKKKHHHNKSHVPGS